jgi:glyoxylase-like metal-dependent hydrolase (beta-lactamase superfamily II)
MNASAQYRNRAVKVPGSSKMNSQYIKTGLYLITGEGNNSVVRLSANGLIIVDDKLPGNYEGLVGRAQKISDQPVRFLMLTDASKSNTGNLAQFLKEGTRVVIQENAAQTLLNQNVVDSKDPSAIIRFDHDRTIHVGGIEVQALYFGNAYSAGNTVVYFPNQKVVAVGQLYSPDAKLEVMDGGSLVRWSAALADVIKLDFDVVIPASGPPVSRDELQAYKAKLDGLISRANALVKQGVPKDQLLLQLNKDDASLRLSLTPGQLDHFYAELSSTKVANR